MRTLGTIFTSFSLLQLAMLACASASAVGDTGELAKQLISASGVQGGLVVHLNCGNGQLTAALRAGDAYLVQGLAGNAQQLDEARANISGKGLYGPVSADLLAGGALPYIDRSVNLLVAEGLAGVPEQEIRRVLVPGGVALIEAGNAGQTDVDGRKLRIAGRDWVKITQPWPEDIDAWTHYLHDATNNAVAHDTAIGPLRHLQWDAGPKYSRHHEFTSSVAAMVSAGGRLFSMMDMGNSASIHMPARWRLTARDAFSGVALWQRPIPAWFNHLWPLKDGPAQTPRRLVAADDAVYVTLGLDAPVSRLDAATGKTLHTYQGTEFTEEILHSDGSLFLLKNNRSMNPKEYHPKLMVCWDERGRTLKESEGYLLKPEPRDILALDAASGRTLWRVQRPVEPLTLAVDDRNVYFHDWTRVVCLDRATGQRRWESEPVAPRETMGYVYGPTLVAYGDVVLFADGRRQRKIHALAKASGQLLWQAPHYAAGHAGSPEDLLVVDGLVWCGKIAGGGDSGVFTGRDPNTGEVKREFTPDVNTYWFHHRCYRAKATDRYILTSRTGIEFVDVRKQSWETHHWVRGACTYGIVPANGLVYAPPHPCACYLESKLYGLSALAPARRTKDEGQRTKQAIRLEEGAAYGKDELRPSSLALRPSEDWPTYRHDPARSGATGSAVGLPLAERWQAKPGGRLTAPVAAGGRVYVASRDTDSVTALDAQTGQTLWTVVTGGPIDSPPTVDGPRVIFGSADGRVYCLRAEDGALVWRFAAAPRDLRLVSYGRVESVWPVHGSVLVRDGVVHCVAGRSTYLDGGLRFYRLDAATGRVLTERRFDDQQNPQKDVKVLNMPVALTDILSCDGRNLYMRSQVFDLDGNRLQTLDPAQDPLDRATQQLGPGAHLFSATGFLDGDAWHRSYWVYGRAFSSGCNWWFRAGRYAPAGRILVVDGDRVYGFGRQPGLFVWSHVLENHLFCAVRQADPQAIARVRSWSDRSGRPAVFDRSFTRRAPVQDRLAPHLHWSVSGPPLQARALVLAGNTLLAAGPPDVLDEDEAFNRPFDPAMQAKIAEQDAAYRGQRGAVLLALAAADGRTLCRRELPAPPVWDGMAVAQGRLLVSTVDGTLVCLANDSQR